MENMSNDILQSYVERIQRVENEIAEMKADEKEIYAEAKSAGIDVKALKQIIKILKIDPNKLEMEEEILKAYRNALGI